VHSKPVNHTAGALNANTCSNKTVEATDLRSSQVFKGQSKYHPFLEKGRGQGHVTPKVLKSLGRDMHSLSLLLSFVQTSSNTVESIFHSRIRLRISDLWF